ncbi:MAG: TIGR00299 family protein [Chloroflexi bacterium RBG_16_48_8]|nr:MAG: TIGR00299 family protein [Chloroflexi bacterium RBG_16_48_8]
MRIAYIDCIAGASGDMLLGALVDVGLSLNDLKEKLELLKLSGFEIEAQQVQKNHLRATHLKVLVTDQKTERQVPEMIEIIQRSDLPEHIQNQAIEIIQKLGEVEARIHGTSLEQVHLHELGGIDTIVDVVGFIVGLDLLKIDELIVSPIPLGRGHIQSAQGEIPLPAPAALELLKGVPVYGVETDKELVTPTGAVLLTSLATSFGSIPPMKVEAVGYGAGTREMPFPNVLRVLIGTKESHYPAHIDRLVLLETNIDDMNPELYDHLMDRLFQNGALDVSLFPIQMKKNRPGTMLQVLTPPEKVMELKHIIYEETTTLGIRQQWIERECLLRRFDRVETVYGSIQIKIADLGEGKIKYSPEYEDCKALAKEHNLPVRVIIEAAIAAFERQQA